MTYHGTTGDAVDTKRALRRALRAGRAGVRRPVRSGSSGQPSDQLLTELILGLIPPTRSHLPIAAYLAQPTEPSTDALLRFCRDQQRPALLPILTEDRDLDWAYDTGTQQLGHWSTASEPSGPRLGRKAITDAGLIVVPALAVDRTGIRLGQGGGSYDRALTRIAADTIVVALLHPGELLDHIPHEPHDRAVDVVITIDKVGNSNAVTRFTH